MSSNKKNSKIKIIENDEIEEKDITTKLVEQHQENNLNLIKIIQ